MSERAKILIDRLKEIELLQKAILARANTRVDFYNKKGNRLYRELVKIQGKCNHSFPNKPNLMGKGICDICGYDDY